ncbi:MAG: hypothetical protein EOO15_09655 [Chitinophagaceae bacterium]|nr:MAG: hypothetical protein EOO15_09655 [Chitinophagaceae bacterium]
MQRIDDILNSLDGATRAEAPPYFYSKLRNRMNSSLLPKPLAWRLALALVVVALLNVMTLRAVRNEGPADDSNAQAIASEYSLTMPETY